MGAQMVIKGGTVIINEDAFTPRNIEKAGFASDPVTDGSLDGFQVFKVPMTSITVRATEDIGIGKKESERAKNMFALGLLSWLYTRPIESTERFLTAKFGSQPIPAPAQFEPAGPHANESERRAIGGPVCSGRVQPDRRPIVDLDGNRR